MTTSHLNLEQIKEIVPQRFPMLMLDQVIDIEPRVRVVGVKKLIGDEFFYQGHFPKRAVTPGAMIAEAIAQTGIIFFHFVFPQPGDAIYLVGSIEMRFLEPVWPGDQIRIEVTPQKFTPRAGIFNAKVFVEDRLVTKGKFSLAVKGSDDL